MDLYAVGSLNASMKTLRLEDAWNRKLANGGAAAHPETDPMKRTQDAAVWQQMVDEQRENEDDKLKTITEKLYAGGKLTAEERKYLRAKNPELYQKLKLVEEDGKSYERELRKCRTKEEVQRLKLSRLGSSLGTVKAVEHNAHIPENKKLELCALEKARCEKIETSTRAFVRRGEYDKLPTEAEQARARKESREAEAERRTEQSPETRPAPEQTEEADAVPEDAGKAGGEKQERIRPLSGGDVLSVPADRETPEGRKVRRARARAAQAYARAAAPEAETPSGSGWEA